jgi:hypothetical protein
MTYRHLLLSFAIACGLAASAPAKDHDPAFKKHSEKEWRKKSVGERDKEYREWLKAQGKADKEWAKASRKEQKEYWKERRKMNR